LGFSSDFLGNTSGDLLPHGFQVEKEGEEDGDKQEKEPQNSDDPEKNFLPSAHGEADLFGSLHNCQKGEPLVLPVGLEKV
jgi:hypothetical protein